MKQYVWLLFALLFTFSLHAEDQSKNTDQRKQRWEQMKAQRAAFYTERIGLTAEEAQRFWPIFNELQDKKGKLHYQMSAQFRNGKRDNNGCPIIDFAKANDDFIRFKVMEANIDKTYHEKFKKVLSPEKLFRYYGAEREWANKLLKDLENGGNRKP